MYAGMGQVLSRTLLSVCRASRSSPLAILQYVAVCSSMANTEITRQRKGKDQAYLRTALPDEIAPNGMATMRATTSYIR